MRPVSARFLAAIAAGTHTPVTHVDVLTTLGDTVPLVGGVVDGSVTLDANAQTRGRLDLSLVDDGTLNLTAVTANDLLAPFGNELRVGRGIRYPDGTEEVPSLGVFPVETCDITESGGLVAITASGGDRSTSIINAKLEAPVQIDAGTETRAAVLALIQDAWPGVPYDIAETGEATPALAGQEGAERWQLAADLVAALGLVLAFDGDGILRFVPSTSGSPVADLIEGGGLLVKATRNWTNVNVKNRWIVTGENTADDQPPVRGVATDLDPASPTFYHGRFGHRPGFVTKSTIATAEQAASVAQTLLQANLGAPSTVSFESVLNPALEPGDIARIKRDRVGIDEEHVFDAVTIPLSPSVVAMSGQTRARQVT